MQQINNIIIVNIYLERGGIRFGNNVGAVCLPSPELQYPGNIGSSTFYLADTDHLDPDPPENTIWFKMLKLSNLSKILLILSFQNNRGMLPKLWIRTRKVFWSPDQYLHSTIIMGSHSIEPTQDWTYTLKFDSWSPGAGFILITYNVLN